MFEVGFCQDPNWLLHPHCTQEPLVFYTSFFEKCHGGKHFFPDFLNENKIIFFFIRPKNIGVISLRLSFFYFIFIILSCYREKVIKKEVFREALRLSSLKTMPESNLRLFILDNTAPPRGYLKNLFLVQ